MSKVLFASLVVAMALAGCAGAGTTTTTTTSSPATPSATSTPATPSTATFTPDVVAQGFAFTPSSYSEDLGGTVAWQNLDATTHTITADDGSFDSGPLAPNAGYNFTTTSAGSFGYHCKIHPAMKGTLVVSAPAASTPSPTTTTSPTPTTTTPTPTPTTTSPPPTPTPVTDGQVAISGFAFQPRTLDVARGASVTWTNADSTTHTVTSDTAAFHSGNLPGDATFTFTFNTLGTFNYHCSIHSSMKGTITVT